MRAACPWPWKLHNSRLAQGGAVFGGGKGGSGGTTYQTQSVSIPPEVRARYDAVNARAEQVAQQPFQPYQGQFVAPMNEVQQAGVNQIGGASGAYQPYYQAATMALGQGQQAATPYYGQAAGMYNAGLGAMAGGYNQMQQGAAAAMPFYGAAAGDIGQAQQAAAPYLDLATAASQQGARAVNPGELNIGKYQNPYLTDVVNTTMANLRQQQQSEQNQLMGSQMMRGAFGGDRAGIAAANLAKQQDMASAQAEAGLRSNAYQQALGAAQQQQGLALGAEQANRAAMGQWGQTAAALGQQAFSQPMAAAQARMGLGQGLYGMGAGLGQGAMSLGQGAMSAGQGLQGVGQGLYGMGAQSAQALQGLGAGSQQAGLAGGQALLGAGTLQQQTQQQLNAANYNQFLQQQGYPFQVAQFLANIALGTGPLYGSTTTGVTGQPTPFFSDERVKEDITEIGRTHDGQKIIKFKYKGDSTPRIGLSAQDVEKHHPEAVYETPQGIKAVDYDAATKHAERASGGPVPVPGIGPDADNAVKSLMPKGLAPPMRQGFAPGGAPGVDEFSQRLLSQLNPLGDSLPHGSFGKLPGKPSAWSPGLAAAKRTSPLGADTRMQAPQQPQQTGLGAAINTVKSGVDMYNTGEKIYDKANDWLKKQRDGQQPPQPGYNASTAPGQIKTETLAAPPNASPAAAPNASPAQEQRVSDASPGLGNADNQLADAGGLMPTMAEDLPLGDIGFAARGGRIHRNPGGRLKTDLPFGDVQNPIVPEGLTDDEPTSDGLNAPKLDMKPPQQQKDTTASDIMNGVKTAASIGMMFLARGGTADIDHAKKLIAGIESGGDYGILGPHVPGQGRAHGKYQIMPANIGPWTEAALGRRMTPEEFLKSPEAQERTFEHRFGQYLAQHGNLGDAASMWHSGVPLAEARRRGLRDVNMSTDEYVRRVLGGAPPAEAVMAHASEHPRSGGLAPPMEKTPELLEIASDDNDPMYQKFNHFAARGGRQHFADGGADETINNIVGQPQGPLWGPGGDYVKQATIDNVRQRRFENTIPTPQQEGKRFDLSPPPEAPQMTSPDGYALNPEQPPYRTDLPAPDRDPIGKFTRSLFPNTGSGTAAAANVPAPAAAPPAPGLVPQAAAATPPPSLENAVPPPEGGNPSVPAGLQPPPTMSAPPVTVRAAPPDAAPTAGASSAPAPGLVPNEKKHSVEDAAKAVGVGKELEKGKLPDPSFFAPGGWFERNQDWVLPLVAGVGKMLSSPSPFLGVAIGQGVAEAAPMALAAQFKDRSLNIQEAQAAANISRYLSENVDPYTVMKDGKPVVMYRDRITQDELTKEQLDARREAMLRQFLPRMRIPGKDTAAAPPAAAPPAAAPPAAAPPAAAPPAAADTALAKADAAIANDMERPSYLEKKIAEEEALRVEATNRGLPRQADFHKDQAEQLRVKLTNIRSGAEQYIPVSKDGTPVRHWADEANRAKNQTDKAKEAEATARQYRDEANNAGAAYLQLQQLASNYRALPEKGVGSPGPTAADRLAVIRGIGTAAQIAGLPNATLLAAPGAAEALAKDTNKLASEMTRVLGGHEAASVFHSIVGATPSISNTPQGFNRIVAGMEQALAYKKEKADFFTQHANRDLNIDDARKAFEKEKPVQEFVAQGLFNMIPDAKRQSAASYLKQYEFDPQAVASIDQRYGNGTAKAIQYLVQRGKL